MVYAFLPTAFIFLFYFFFDRTYVNDRIKNSVIRFLQLALSGFP